MSRRASLALLLCAAAALAGCETTVTREEAAAVDYGPRPVHWQEVIRGYLAVRLTDPIGALVELRTEPQRMYQRQTPVRARQWGWASCVWVNDRNRQGAFEGFYPMTFFIRNEKIVAVNGGPEDANIIGARYAREQCERLGAPFRQ
jgi:hypothetical protein